MTYVLCVYFPGGVGGKAPRALPRAEVAGRAWSVQERQAMSRFDRPPAYGKPASSPSRPDLPLPASKPHIFKIDMSCHLDHSPATTFFQIRSISFLSHSQLHINLALREHVREGPLS